MPPATQTHNVNPKSISKFLRNAIYGSVAPVCSPGLKKKKKPMIERKPYMNNTCYNILT